MVTVKVQNDSNVSVLPLDRPVGAGWRRSSCTGTALPCEGGRGWQPPSSVGNTRVVLGKTHPPQPSSQGPEKRGVSGTRAEGAVPGNRDVKSVLPDEGVLWERREEDIEDNRGSCGSNSLLLFPLISGAIRVQLDPAWPVLNCAYATKLEFEQC